MRQNEIAVGNWCIFKHDGEEADSIIENVVVGSVADFKYSDSKSTDKATGSSDRKKTKKKTLVADSIEVDSVNSEKIEVLASWYRIDIDGFLQPVQTKNCFFIPIKSYVASVETPKIEMHHHTQSKILSLKDNIHHLQDELNDLF